jgi:F0F1-type ATP synthase assembly protein I
MNWAKSLTMAINLSTSVGAAIGAGLLGGRWLDAKFETGNLLTILGFMLGVATAGKMMWDKLQEQSRISSTSASREDDDKRQ